MPTDLSVIIASYNTREILLNCLRSLERQPSSYFREIIVVDNASDDQSVEAVHSECPAVRVIANRRNLGFSGASNQGMAVAQGRYILLLNSDTLIDDNSIDLMLEFMETHPKTALLGCQLLNVDGTLQMSIAPMPNLFILLVQALGIRLLIPSGLLKRLSGGKKLARIPVKSLRNYFSWGVLQQASDLPPSRELTSEEYLPGACLMIRRSCVEQIGFLDENFFMYGEDADLSRRAYRAGWKLVCLHTARVTHLVGRSTGAHYRDLSLQAQRSILYFFYKHRSRGVFLAAKCLRMLGVLRHIAAAFLQRNGHEQLRVRWQLLAGIWNISSFPSPAETVRLHELSALAK